MHAKMPAVATSDSGAHMLRQDEAPMTEIFLEETDDRAETVDADITHLAEQRAMHTELRYQMQALRHNSMGPGPSAKGDFAEDKGGVPFGEAPP